MYIRRRRIKTTLAQKLSHLVPRPGDGLENAGIGGFSVEQENLSGIFEAKPVLLKK